MRGAMAMSRPLEPSRRQCLQWGLQWAPRVAVAGSLALVWPLAAHAGGQIEEPLADSVRLALRAAVDFAAPPEPEFDSTTSRLAYLRWLGDLSPRLQRRKPDLQTRVDFLQTVWYETRRAGRH